MKHLAVLLILASFGCQSAKAKWPVAKDSFINCMAPGLGETAVQLIPLVNRALVSESPNEALEGLYNPAIGVGVEVIACLVRASVAAYSDAVEANPGDPLANKGLNAARNFLNDHNIKFTPETEAAIKSAKPKVVPMTHTVPTHNFD